MIDTKRFFIIGIICFSVIGICQAINLIIFFGGYNIFSIIISAMQTVFSFVTASFFYYLYKTSFPSEEIKVNPGEDIGAALEEFSKNAG